MNAQCILNGVPIGTSRPERVSRLENADECIRCTWMHIRTVNLAPRVLRDRESCIDKSSPTFARPAYTGALRRGVAATGFSWLTGTLMARRAMVASSCEPRLRDRLDTADGNLPEKSAINADTRGREGREVTRKRNILSSKYGERRAAIPP